MRGDNLKEMNGIPYCRKQPFEREAALPFELLLSLSILHNMCTKIHRNFLVLLRWWIPDVGDQDLEFITFRPEIAIPSPQNVVENPQRIHTNGVFIKI